MARSLKKVVYFDETSAMDLLQIEKKGSFKKTVELITNAGGTVKGNSEVTTEVGKQGAMKLLFEKAIGASGTFHAGLGTNGSFQGERIAKTILENSLLYDFLDTVEFRKKNPLIDISDNYKLSIENDSMTYYAMIAPITEMMEGNHQIDDTSDITMTISKMNSVIRNSKGYFDLVGENKTDKRVYRFNIESFKNNYRIQDLRKMNLTLYSIHVGETTIADLKFETEFEINEEKTELQFQGFGNKQNTKVPDKENEKKIPVYDVLLAGVK
ncbi:hypothetical protein JOC54_000344 [Alkalihalobacillus xiaoxiensis]|uniref:Uncharacterized protein n=1 Tax=Shouchella xiaoxiensis TaxID=766895 RepID=A0ABS2SNL7_9BACI|nr:DUF6414 family protein [Shouchella xiaoxiensis]MBM7837113.1 hypothetical protein [Shouchella xiaoxiensis]